jgi:hypothetical protein
MITTLLSDLRTSLLAIVPGFEVVRAYSQNVPRPLGNYIMMTTISLERLSTSSGIGNTKKFKARTIVQLDIFADNAMDTALLINHYYRSSLIETIPYAGAIYATSPRQLMMYDDEARMDERWMLELHIERDDELVLSTQTANTLDVGIIEAEMYVP